MSKENNFYITTTLPYTNADPHIGFAAEILKADVIARYQALQGKNVFFNTGSDEHGLKIKQQADEAGLPVLEYCNHYVERFKSLIDEALLIIMSSEKISSPSKLNSKISSP